MRTISLVHGHGRPLVVLRAISDRSLGGRGVATNVRRAPACHRATDVIASIAYNGPNVDTLRINWPTGLAGSRTRLRLSLILAAFAATAACLTFGVYSLVRGALTRPVLRSPAALLWSLRRQVCLRS